MSIKEIQGPLSAAVKRAASQDRMFGNLPNSAPKKRNRVAEGDPIAKSVNRQLRKRLKTQGSIVAIDPKTFDLMTQANSRGADFHSIPGQMQDWGPYDYEDEEYY